MKDLTMEFKKMEDFTGVYQTSETLTFELRPQGKTEEMLRKSGLLEQDEKRADDYPAVKEFIDNCHKALLQRVLSKVSLDWNDLAEKIREFRKNPDLIKELENCQAEYRNKLFEAFKKDEQFDELTASTPDKLLKGSSDDKIKTFEGFACYFAGFQENRKNIYSKEAQSTSAAYRVVNENFTEFFNAIQCYKTMKGEPDLIAEIEKKHGCLADFFAVESYNRFLSQSGIDSFNDAAGKINYEVNQYRQAHSEISAKNLPFIPTLFKQILSDRDASFSIGGFRNDDEVFAALKDFVENTIQGKFLSGNSSLIDALRYYLKNISEDNELFVNAGSLESISKKTTGRWDLFQEAVSRFAEENFKRKNEREKYCKRKIFSFKDIVSWNISVFSEDGTAKPVCFTAFWNENSGLFEREKNLRSKLMEVFGKKERKSLKDRSEDVEIIKEYLDSVQELFHLLKPLQVGGEVGGDVNLIGTLNALYHQLEKIIPLYNHIRNYITKKPEDSAKIKLMFNCPTLANGWDKNKEKENHAVILRDGSAYFLGVSAPGAKIDLNQFGKTANEPVFQKMVYKLLPGPNKMLPKVFFSNKNKELFSPSQSLLNKYQAGKHKKGSDFDLSFCHELIDFFKSSIAKHEDWSKFGFQFSRTSDYQGIDEFYREVAEQGYSITFTEVSKSEIWKLVDAGKLFLFQIWSKDFSEKSTGAPNKFTLYWKALFEKENLSNVVFKLNGEAELFWRKAVVERKITHKPGEKVVNRTIVTGMDGDRALRIAMPEEIHSEIYRMVNGKMAASDLSGETKKFLEEHPRLDWKTGMPIQNALLRTVVKDVPFEMIKDSRYTVEKYQFHVPVTINFKSPSEPIKFNETVLKYLRDNPDVKIIGLDRGERHLIYLVLMDQQGRILKQKSLNVMGGVDYHSKLDQREKERDTARKSWTSIGKIKDLKDGYLSQVVYEIARMMVEENAIVVMEDLNFGFKRGRMKIEKQVYQKFEKALIDKLNYLTFKNIGDFRAPGGLLDGYQLADKFTSFAKIGKQCGFIFYIPAGYTSKIDPATGFVNLFKMNDCTSADSVKTFFENFDSIRYHEKEDAFAFQFDYKNFKNTQNVANGKWTVWSTREAWRNERDKSSGKFNSIPYDPTLEIKNALKEIGVLLKDGLDLKCVLLTASSRNSPQFFHKILNAFKLTVALRHSSKDVDKIISPVRNAENECFDSSRHDPAMPENADANGAYHIALKGLYLLRNKISEDGKLGKVSTEEWLNFARARHSK